MCEKMPEQARFWAIAFLMPLLAPVTTAMQVILVGWRAEEAKEYAIGRDDKMWRSGSENIYEKKRKSSS